MTDAERQAIAVRIAEERMSEAGFAPPQFIDFVRPSAVMADGSVLMCAYFTVSSDDVEATHASDKAAQEVAP